MLISQTAAIRKIRTATGHTEVWATEAVKGLKKTQSGKLLKVSSYAVEKLISETNHEIEKEIATPSTIRPLSPNKIRRIQERCI